MKKYITGIAVCLSLFAAAQPETISHGKTAPDISLMNVNNKVVSFKDYSSAKGFIVVFTCNTCPYSRAYEKRIIELDKKYTLLGFPVIAVNPNDPSASPADTFDKMKEHAKAAKFTFPYLYDKEQAITTLYGAKSTPHVFIITKTPQGNTIAYTGAIDNDTQDTDPNKTKYVEDVVSALLHNKKAEVSVTKAIGCRIKWKKG